MNTLKRLPVFCGAPLRQPVLNENLVAHGSHVGHRARNGGGQRLFRLCLDPAEQLRRSVAAGDAAGLHGKTYLFYVHSELHTQKDYRVLEALELDGTRPDATQWFESYASPYRHAGIPLVDLLKLHEAKRDPRLYVSWYAGTVEEANPSLNGPLGPTLEDIEDAHRRLLRGFTADCI